MSSNEWSNSFAAARAAPALPGRRAGAALVRTGELLLLLALTLPVRLVWLEADAHIDELYHLLAAEGWLASGEPRIGSGLYGRAFLFTALVGWFMDVLGHSLQVARLPSVIAGTALVLAVFVWTRRLAGPLAGWSAALLLAWSPLAVELSQLARFYALHALALWLACVCAWCAVTSRDAAPVRAALALLALIFALLAMHLQVLTLIGLAGFALWLGGLALPHAWAWLRPLRPQRVALTLAALALVLAATAALASSGILDQLVTRYRWAPLWASEFQNQVHFYLVRLTEQYPLLWPLTPLLMIAALTRHPRAAALFTCVFGTAFVLGSFAGMKDERYLFYALPFLFALWGIGFAAIAHGLARAVLDLIERARLTAAPCAPRHLTTVALTAGALAFMLSASGAPAKLAFDLAQGERPAGPGRVSADWSAAAGSLRPWIEQADAVVVSDELAALATLGRADVLISTTRLLELSPQVDAGPGLEFSRDPRTGTLVISTPDSIAALMRCHADGLILLSKRDLAFDWAIRPETYAAITAAARPLAIPGEGEVQALFWQRAAVSQEDCPAVFAARPAR